ncbi:hypothetical protein CSPHI_10610 [Corynebacterium sphenisci DSM 44792]|uniref:Uncharacterized protein n=1 Tax=Corynebacterium sphenisci DSM 44792 TaxID=1437874 RepID=A0A1L7CZX6_9CORY|nr:hypothetical protein [Corynebacterium sphenisci]APT91370.1 hypothetical protein CSPHI_10610 [Corynebacterium sphenisci DSM 44792]
MPNQTPPGPGADRFTDPTLPPETLDGGAPAGAAPGAPAGATAVPAPDGGTRRTLMIVLAVLVALLVAAVAVTALLTRGGPEPKYLPLPGGPDSRDSRWDYPAEGLLTHAIDTPDALLVNSAWQQALVDVARGAAPGDPMPEELADVEVEGIGAFDCHRLPHSGDNPGKKTMTWECRGPIRENAETGGYGMQVVLTPQAQGVGHGMIIPSDPQWAEHAIDHWGYGQ